MTTLVIGARGSVGRHVLDQLVEAGEPVRASVRNPVPTDFPATVPVVAADLAKPDTLGPALDGVRSVFLYATPSGMEDFAVAAVKAGVEHVVVMSSGSVLLPHTAGNASTEEHRAVERVLTGSGLRWTPVRPLVLANNALNWAWSIRDEGVVRLLHPEAVMAPVHERDVASVAVAALAGKDGVDELLTGPEPLTQRRQVELVAEAVGLPIRVEELTESQATEQFARFMPVEIAASIVRFVVEATRGGSPTTDTALRVLGRPPLTFARWAEEHAAEFGGATA
ncbi:NAD(P)H-binding protein [Umezawaea sp. Da 62-37]|uniref:SDR family oxidoreductase n=1 Tax=Umezawaea sp. Da 62-37 TaxID=3075927 RepID=UPI0028F6DE79|nr:NAD(P)H-binding protein [Umezawaea sp. Da 62-37]WNV84397.1 NAD(P)H-binding protein [Umezawaea sp. Da 62-37]